MKAKCNAKKKYIEVKLNTQSKISQETGSSGSIVSKTEARKKVMFSKFNFLQWNQYTEPSGQTISHFRSIFA